MLRVGISIESLELKFRVTFRVMIRLVRVRGGLRFKVMVIALGLMLHVRI